MRQRLHPSIGSARQRSATLLEEESALHKRIVERDEAALLEYLDRSGHIVYCVALALTEDAAAAEDLTEGLFLDLWRLPDRFHPRNGPMVLQLLQRTAARSPAGVGTLQPHTAN
ncbi:MAG: hypothetical protein M3179_06840 [Actinomycetota bacterium]|nr:hypothetical protein [Actinomycetota bacterium]